MQEKITGLSFLSFYVRRLSKKRNRAPTMMTTLTKKQKKHVHPFDVEIREGTPLENQGKLEQWLRLLPPALDIYLCRRERSLVSLSFLCILYF